MRSPLDWLERRENARWQFSITQGQMEICYIMVTSHGRSHAAVEVHTVKKYPEVLGYGGTEMHIQPSESTLKDGLDATLPVTASVTWPARWRGWEVVTETLGRYSVRFVLLRPEGRVRSCPVEVISEDERVTRILAEDSPRGIRKLEES